jgi:hypothetical protein
MTVFLHDIELMDKGRQATTNICGACLSAIFNCSLPCFLLGLCCNSCCGDHPRAFHVSGGFGTRAIILKSTEVDSAARDVTAMLVPVKQRK